MTSCPNCGMDLKDARKLVKRSAAELVESLQLDAKRLGWCALNFPELKPSTELEAFKERMRSAGYRLSGGKGAPVKDAWSAFQTHMRRAEEYRQQRQQRYKPAAPQRTRPERKEE